MTDEAWRRVKQGRKEIDAEQEAQLEASEQTRRKRERLRRSLGGLTPRDERGDESTDKEVALTLEGALRSRKVVRLAGRWGPGVTYRGRTSDPAKMMDWWPEDYEEDPDTATIWVPEWRHTKERLKTFAWIMVLGQEGHRARSMSLNLGPEVIAMAERAAVTRKMGFARFMREKITKELHRKLDPLGMDIPDFFLWIEAPTAERAHVHGAIVIPESDRPVATLRAIRNALKAAGGNWNPEEHENQLRLRPAPNAGWGRYISKSRLLSRLQLQTDNTVAATRDLRTKASAWYKQARETGDPIKG